MLRARADRRAAGDRHASWSSSSGCNRSSPQSEERAKSHWDQYLRAVAELDNVRKRAQRDIEAANRYGLEKFVLELLPVQGQPGACGGERRQRRQLQASPRVRRRPCSFSTRLSSRSTSKTLDPLGRALRSRAPRGDAGAALGERGAQFDPEGGSARLRAEWPPAAAGARHRRQGSGLNPPNGME